MPLAHALECWLAGATPYPAICGLCAAPIQPALQAGALYFSARACALMQQASSTMASAVPGTPAVAAGSAAPLVQLTGAPAVCTPSHAAEQLRGTR